MNPAEAIELLPLCGDCALAYKGTVTSDRTPLFGEGCVGGDCAAAATAIYACPKRAIAAARPTAPHLEIVEIAPSSLDAATHAAQALDLLAAWTHGEGGAGAAECDKTMVSLAVAAVERVHRAVQNGRR